jgi:hypothetical protein
MPAATPFSSCSGELRGRQIGYAGPKTIDRFGQASFVGFASGAVAISLNPFRMLNTQVIMNPLLEFSVGMDLDNGAGGRREVVCFHVYNVRFQLTLPPRRVRRIYS